MASERFVSASKGNGGSVLTVKPVSVLAPPGLVSVLVPCCGMLEYTKLCVPSLIRYSRQPVEFLFLDIGSLDGTAEYLAGIQAAVSGIRVEVFRTPTDLGIHKVVEEAVLESRGEYVVLLNNDTIVTDGWLNQLIALASTSAGIGLVGPMSNYAAPPQLIEDVPYRFGPRKGRGTGTDEALVDLEEIQRFARGFRDKYKGQWMEVDRLGGFCLLLKRQVLDRTKQSLGKWTDLSLFDTDILSAKAREAGFTLALCRDLFIHHFGTRIFAHGAPAGENGQPFQRASQ